MSDPFHKRLEVVAKTWVGWLLALLFWRPGRRERMSARLTSAKRVLVMRIDNRIGEALLTTPLLEALHRAGYEVDLLAHPKCLRVFEHHPHVHRLVAFEGASTQFGDYDVIINAASWESYSGTPALWARRLGSRACIVGPAVGPARLLADVAVPARADTVNEVEQRLHLLSPLIPNPTGPMSFRQPRPSAELVALVERLPRFAVVNPGGRLRIRGLPAEAFAAACLELSAQGVQPVVTWGPGEEALADAVLRQSPGAQLAPPTTLDDLAYLMKRAAVVVCNNTGPMHLSVAVGAQTLAFFLNMPKDRWGHGAPHDMVDVTGLESAQVIETVRESVKRFLAESPLTRTQRAAR